MKKKIVSLILVCTLIIPCVFLVACKSKQAQSLASKYTYSIVLKNAKGKVDEASLVNEYDYSKSQVVGFESNGDDYNLSVTKMSALSGKIKFNLIEGIDYTDLTMSVNGKNGEFSVKNNTNKNLSSEITLTDRYFEYNYNNMKNDTAVVVDFTNCSVGTVNINVSELRGKAKYKVLEDDFLLPSEDGISAIKSGYEYVSAETIGVKYGSVVIFDYDMNLVLTQQTNENLNNLSYIKNGYEYVKSDNKLQYFIAKTNAVCKAYSTSLDYNYDGTLRIAFDMETKVANSLDNLIDGVYLSPTYETETYESQELMLSVYSGERLFVEVDTDNVYYLLSELGGAFDSESSVRSDDIKTSSDINYIEVVLFENGDYLPVKYLFRSPNADTSGMKYVYASRIEGVASITNADFVFVGKDNFPNKFHEEDLSPSIIYGFWGDTINLKLNETLLDDDITYSPQIEKVTINETDYNPRESQDISLNISDLTKNDETELYMLSAEYFLETEVTTSVIIELKFSQMNLLPNEELYCSTDFVNWEMIDTESSFINIYLNGGTIYYYLKSSSANTTLTIVDEDGEDVCVEGKLVDYFGRTLSQVMVDGACIEASQIHQIKLEPQNYSIFNNYYVIKQFDMNYHAINFDEETLSGNVMIAVGGFSADKFKPLNSEQKLTINSAASYNEMIYYYVKAQENKCLVLKNRDGEAVSTSDLVYYQNEPLLIDGNFVYCLSLNFGHYEQNEILDMEVVGAKYTLYRMPEQDVEKPEEGETEPEEAGDPILLFLDSMRNEYVDSMEEGKTYYFMFDDYTGEFYLEIVDEDGNIIVGKTDIQYISHLSSTSLYSVYFTIPNNSEYIPGTRFYVRKTMLES